MGATLRIYKAWIKRHGTLRGGVNKVSTAMREHARGGRLTDHPRYKFLREHKVPIDLTGPSSGKLVRLTRHAGPKYERLLQKHGDKKIATRRINDRLFRRLANEYEKVLKRDLSPNELTKIAKSNQYRLYRKRVTNKRINR